MAVAMVVGRCYSAVVAAVDFRWAPVAVRHPASNCPIEPIAQAAVVAMAAGRSYSAAQAEHWTHSDRTVRAVAAAASVVECWVVAKPGPVDWSLCHHCGVQPDDQQNSVLLG